MTYENLYSCSATIFFDVNRKEMGLISYNTRVFTINLSKDCFAVMWLYPSITSKQHIRKFGEWCCKNNFGFTGEAVRYMYKWGMTRNARFVYYDLQTGEIKEISKDEALRLL